MSENLCGKEIDFAKKRERSLERSLYFHFQKVSDSGDETEQFHHCGFKTFASN